MSAGNHNSNGHNSNGPNSNGHPGNGTHPGTPANRLASFAPKTAATAAQDSSGMRPSLIFLGLGVIVTIAIISWLGLFRETEDIRLDIKDITVKNDGNVELTGAQYRGRLETGANFEITADRASEFKDGSGQVQLEEPVASIYYTDGTTTSATSQSGTFYQNRNEVALRGSVIVTDYGRDMTLQSETLTANLTTGDMQSDTPVEIRATTGHITANRMQSRKKGTQIIFEGDPKMTLHNIAGFE